VIPDLTALAILLGLVPGWVFLTLQSKQSPRGTQSLLMEAVGLVAVGILTTGVAVLMWVWAGNLDLPWLLSASGWARGGSVYLLTHLSQVALTIALAVAFSCLLAFGLAKLFYRGKGMHNPDGIVWWGAFREGVRYGEQPFVGVMMDDGVLIEGLLTGFTTDDKDSTGRDLALARPINVTWPGGNSIRQNIDRILIPERIMRYVTIIYVNPGADVSPTKPAVAPPTWRKNSGL